MFVALAIAMAPMHAADQTATGALSLLHAIKAAIDDHWLESGGIDDDAAIHARFGAGPFRREHVDDTTTVTFDAAGDATVLPGAVRLRLRKGTLSRDTPGVSIDVEARPGNDATIEAVKALFPGRTFREYMLRYPDGPHRGWVADAGWNEEILIGIGPGDRLSDLTWSMKLSTAGWPFDAAMPSICDLVSREELAALDLHPTWIEPGSMPRFPLGPRERVCRYETGHGDWMTSSSNRLLTASLKRDPLAQKMVADGGASARAREPERSAVDALGYCVRYSERSGESCSAAVGPYLIALYASQPTPHTDAEWLAVLKRVLARVTRAMAADTTNRD